MRERLFCIFLVSVSTSFVYFRFVYFNLSLVSVLSLLFNYLHSAFVGFHMEREKQRIDLFLWIEQMCVCFVCVCCILINIIY